MKKKAIILLSGGMDSSVVLAMAKSEGFECYGLTFDYGQRHKVEIEAARQQVQDQKIKNHLVFKLDIGNFGGSALTDNIKVPKINSGEDKSNDQIPVTYVPGRNMIFLSIAAGYGETIGARDIFTGVSSVDYSGYPDCRPEFIESMNNTINLATKSGDEGNKFVIHAPLINLTKEETVAIGKKLGVEFKNTRTCYDPHEDGGPCGECDACILRAKGFKGLGEKDPVVEHFEK
ncbi:MAG: 7-cyano-7-deazaguanine synthase QueC [Deltaproteobacteria bacterium]|nr:7-cyano-7-deazaguanine synthase QueC [Deltaproteobacteria bacterium]